MKLPSFLLTATIVSILVSCGGAEGTKVQTTGEKITSTAPTEEAPVEKKGLHFKLNETIKLGDYVITVTKVIDNAPAPDEFSTPENGKKFVVIEVLYENPTTDKQLTYNPFDWKLYDGDSYVYELDMMNNAKGPELQDGTLNPGQKVRGWITFQTAKNASNFKAQFQPDWFGEDNVEVQLQ